MLVDAVRGLAAELGISAAQLALAWLLHQGTDIVPIPGTRSVTRLDENAAAATIQLSADTQTRLRQIPDSIPVQGTRYPAQHMGAVNL